MYDYSRLRGRIIEIYGTISEFGLSIGKDASYVSRLLNGRANFTQRIINAWVDALNIEPTDIGDYFFQVQGGLR